MGDPVSSKHDVRSPSVATRASLVNTTPSRRWAWSSTLLGWAAVMSLGSCSDHRPTFDATDPARGPGGLIADKPVSSGDFPWDGTASPMPAAGATPPSDASLPSCDDNCRRHCGTLALSNPLDAAICPSLWGVGLDTRPVVAEEACRRLYADLIGRFPSADEAADCAGRPFGDTTRTLMATPEFVLLQQRRWADRLLYNNRAVSVERLFDMDRLVGKLYRGLVAYDAFAAVVSAHPALMRRLATPGDRAEGVFTLFIGRPPYENERSDFGRLYTMWENGYYDHPTLRMRLPDATLKFRCTSTASPDERGECTSVLWGYNELTLDPDIRARNGEMWSGLLRPEEWQKLQLPGRLLAQQPAFWEHAVDDVLVQYLGYDLGPSAPAVRAKLVEALFEYGGDIRAVHHAVVTSRLYLQSTTGAAPTAHRWTYGPLKQIEVETWLDTIERATGVSLGRCDHRLPQPELVLEEGGLAGMSLVQQSRWPLDDRGRVSREYRDLARTLGGCPENEVGGRFKAVSVLSTATQEAFVERVCNPGASPDRKGAAPIDKLLPAGTDAKRAIDPELADAILGHQVALFLGRAPRSEELAEARAAAEACGPKPCAAETFARPLCYAILSSSEMLFY
jgi:hypothetical protein